MAFHFATNFNSSSIRSKGRKSKPQAGNGHKGLHWVEFLCHSTAVLLCAKWQTRLRHWLLTRISCLFRAFLNDFECLVQLFTWVRGMNLQEVSLRSLKGDETSSWMLILYEKFNPSPWTHLKLQTPRGDANWSENTPRYVQCLWTPWLISEVLINRDVCIPSPLMKYVNITLPMSKALDSFYGKHRKPKTRPPICWCPMSPLKRNEKANERSI